MSALTVRQLSEIARYEFGAMPGTPIEMRELVNQAGEHLVASYPWKWLEGRSATLRPRAEIEIEDATWTEATKTLTKVAGFTDYDFLSADTAEVTSGTGATAGQYQVSSKTSNDAIVLATSIGSAADGQTDIAVTLPNDQIALPGDFDIQAITAWGMTDGLLGFTEPTTPQTMLDLRSWPGLGSTIGFWVLLRHVRATGIQPVQRLEMWPRSSTEDEAIVIFYRAGWAEPASDTEVLSIPNWMNSLFIEMFKAVVNGHEKPAQGSIDQRLTALRQGVLWRDAVMRDGLAQADLGPTECGWLEVYQSRVGRYSAPLIVPT